MSSNNIVIVKNYIYPESLEDGSDVGRSLGTTPPERVVVSTPCRHVTGVHVTESVRVYRSESLPRRVESPFEILGIDADASDEEIVAAYRQRVKEAHPDQGGSAAEFQRVRAAYEELQQGYQPDALDVADAVDQTTNGESDGTDDPATADAREPSGPHIEYLNFETFSDHGWDLGDDDLFEKAAAADLAPEDYGVFSYDDGRNLLQSAEDCGYSWPFACRGGACANCAVAVVEGEVEMPSNHILSQEMVDRGIRLSCISEPISDELKVIYNIKHLPGLDDLRLPPQQFGGAND